jgi:hypothetical protein
MDEWGPHDGAAGSDGWIGLVLAVLVVAVIALAYVLGYQRGLHALSGGG